MHPKANRQKASKIERQVCRMFKRGDARIPFNLLMQFLSLHGETPPSDGVDFFNKVAQLIEKLEGEARRQGNVDPQLLFLKTLERRRKVNFLNENIVKFLQVFLLKFLQL